MSALDLPSAEPQSPSCGACHGETTHDGDVFACYDCRLAFDPADLSAEYLDTEADPCGRACDNEWHRPDALAPGSRWSCGTCVLPDDHDPAVHHTGCRPIVAGARP